MLRSVCPFFSYSALLQPQSTNTNWVAHIICDCAVLLIIMSKTLVARFDLNFKWETDVMAAFGLKLSPLTK